MFDASLSRRRVDLNWPLMLATVGLMAVGIAFIYSAASATEVGKTWYKQMYFHQAVWCVMGIGMAAAIGLVSYARVARWSTVIFWATVVLLVLVLFVGTSHHGSKRWINLGPFSLQPSEFAKIGFILLLANFLSRPVEELRSPSVMLKTLGLTLVPFVLVKVEPDMGSAFVFLAISVAMMFVAGVPARLLAWLVGSAGLLGILMVVVILFPPRQFKELKLVKPYQRNRLVTFFGQNATPTNAPLEVRREAARIRHDINYNVDQAMISVGSGGLVGKGWRQGTQHTLGFLPRAVACNDFIFSVIAEEEGFAGSVVVLGLYTIVLLSGIKIASQARDRLGLLLAVGVVTMLFCHVFINIGMNIRIMPVTGIPLPLVSSGGSAVVCSLIAIGMLHNIQINRRSY